MLILVCTAALGFELGADLLEQLDKTAVWRSGCAGYATMRVVHGDVRLRCWLVMDWNGGSMALHFEARRDFARRREQAQCLGDPKPYYNTPRYGFVMKDSRRMRRLRWMLLRDDDEWKPKGRQTRIARKRLQSTTAWLSPNGNLITSVLFFDHSRHGYAKSQFERASRVGLRDQPHPQQSGINLNCFLHHVCPPPASFFVETL